MSKGLKVILAISHDGYVCRGDEDKMDWTGQSDKQVFRMLTGVGGAVGVGSRTFKLMPFPLDGRELFGISDRAPGISLGAFAHSYPDGWLAGGQTLVMAALRMQMVGEVHLCRNPTELGFGTRDEVTPFMQLHDGWRVSMTTRLNWGALVVETWRRG